MQNKDVVFKATVDVTKQHLEAFIETLNAWDRPTSPLTLEEVLSKPVLLKYICSEAVEDGVAMYDPEEFWSNDGWCDWQDYR